MQPRVRWPGCAIPQSAARSCAGTFAHFQFADGAGRTDCKVRGDGIDRSFWGKSASIASMRRFGKFASKPRIVSAIRRGGSTIMSKAALLARITDDPRLPTPPSVALQILDRANRPQSTVAEISQLISHDP